MIRLWALVSLAMAFSAIAWADDSWYGIVKQEPLADDSQWKIGDAGLRMGSDADIKLKAGRLEVGACAQVEAEDGVIGTAITRAMSHCDDTDYDAYFASFKSLGEKGS